jgi:hypothetical protein
MQDLIEHVIHRTGLDPETAERAIGIMLSLVKSQGDQAKVDTLFEKLPGASDLATAHGGDGANGGGLLSMFGGGLMGGPLAAVARLQAAGLDMEQVKGLGDEVFNYAKGQAGEDLVRDVASSIPGLSRYL